MPVAANQTSRYVTPVYCRALRRFCFCSLVYMICACASTPDKTAPSDVPVGAKHMAHEFDTSQPASGPHRHGHVAGRRVGKTSDNKVQVTSMPSPVVDSPTTRRSVDGNAGVVSSTVQEGAASLQNNLAPQDALADAQSPRNDDVPTVLSPKIPAMIDASVAAAADSLVLQLQKRLAQTLNDRAEREILSLLVSAPTQVFNRVVGRLDLYRLLDGIDDHALGRKNRRSLLLLLTVQRIHDLDVVARARLVDALQKGRTGSDDEQAIAKIFLATRGRELSELKLHVDSGSDHRDLMKLIYSDIDSKQIRTRVIEHFQQDAGQTTSRCLRVVSDIDDTLYANWVDERYPKQTLYPGVRAFYAAFGLASDCPDGMPKVVFLTARPGDRLGVVENITHATLRNFGLENSVVLTGDIANVYSNAAIAKKKLANFAAYQQLYPEHDFVFVGDSGQGDALLGKMLLVQFPSHVRAVFIHDVVGVADGDKKIFVELGVSFFESYFGAALQAHRMHLLRAQDLVDVAAATCAELKSMNFVDVTQQQQRLNALALQLHAAKSMLENMPSVCTYID